MAKKRFEIASFKVWLVERGAILLSPTNPYEVLRVDTAEGLFVVYQNKAGKQTWPMGIDAIRSAYLDGRDVPLSPDQKQRVRLRHQIEALAARDGLFCWFCENGFLSVDSREITIEHLVSVAHGGPHHVSNLVLACPDCNGEAGLLSVAEKVMLRDAKRNVAPSASAKPKEAHHA
jgi:hypothetical protein